MRVASPRPLRLAVPIAALALTGCAEPAAPIEEPLPETGAVNVQVRTEADALQGAAVYLYPAGEARPFGTATTPPNGRVTFDSVPAGDYEIRVTGPAEYVPIERRPLGAVRGQHTNVTITLEAVIPGSPNASLIVRVTDVNGAPVAGIPVVRSPNPSGVVPSTDATGWVYFLRIPQGEYYTELRLDERWQLAPGEPERKRAEVWTGNTTTTEWRIRPAE